VAALASWPPGLVYALILASCFVENAFPPSPSDVFVVMASFLSHRGSYDPLMVMLTALVGGIAGAVTVYTIARRNAASFGRTRLGRAVLPPEATAFLLKEYGRYGALGLFLTRLLPGFRSVVAPFAGLSGLGPFAALAPIGLACVAWYAALTLIGSRLGAEWNAIRGVLDDLNDVLLVAALVLAAAIVWWIVRRRRRKAP